eukprot:230328_1
MVHYFKTKNCVLIIPSEPQCIYLYSLSTNNCQIFPINISCPMSYPKAVCSRNEQYIIVFGNLNNNINVFDLKLRKTWTSNIKKDTFVREVTIISDINKEELLCFGYIRQCWASSKFIRTRFLPYYLIKLIDAYFAFEIIHMMNTD